MNICLNRDDGGTAKRGERRCCGLCDPVTCGRDVDKRHAVDAPVREAHVLDVTQMSRLPLTRWLRALASRQRQIARTLPAFALFFFLFCFIRHQQSTVPVFIFIYWFFWIDSARLSTEFWFTSDSRIGREDSPSGYRAAHRIKSVSVTTAHGKINV